MASLSDILTTAQNIATAINNAARTYVAVQGVRSAKNISTDTLVSLGAGRVATVSVVTAGSTEGAIYDANSTTSPVDAIYTIPNTLGVIFLNMPVASGVVVSPGTGQVVAVSYS